jgi:hypothetical protein
MSMCVCVREREREREKECVSRGHYLCRMCVHMTPQIYHPGVPQGLKVGLRCVWLECQGTEASLQVFAVINKRTHRRKDKGTRSDGSGVK